MLLHSIKNSSDPSHDLSIILKTLHEKGPKDPKVLEKLSFYKEFHPGAFSELEEKILSALGLFYKIDKPDNLYSFLMSQFGKQHIKTYGAALTPIQASIRRAVDTHQYTSISAPTSAGKSYSIRDFISVEAGDAVIIVPSRALIAEYMNAMRRTFGDNKSVMITSFVDLIYTSRHLRRIFILTPERSKDLYKIKHKLNIDIFFFDEAQTSEEAKRGIVFDVTVRRVRKHFPNAKIIFAHPFVENPEAQFSKHNIPSEHSYAHSYSHGSVGRICIFQHTNGNCYYFSPYLENGHHLRNSLEFKKSFKEFALKATHTILVYVSKSAIYKGSFTEEFSEYIDKLGPVTNKLALEKIKNIQHILGADSSSHKSSMVELLKKGVVIHHGSIPLEVRFLIEDFIRDGHALLCFSTSTLAQGINMPFDIVWLINNRFMGDENERALAFKNLIGRAGRLSKEKCFDYGYVYTSEPKSFSNKIRSSFTLEANSILDADTKAKDNDTQELIDSIQNDTFDDDKNMPLTKVQRLSQDAVLGNAKSCLDIIYRHPDSIKNSIGGDLNRALRERARQHLQVIYEAALGRDLLEGERAVFEQAISIFFQMIQGRSFREIVGIRYNYITGRDDKSTKHAKFSQPAESLPNSTLDHSYSIFSPETPVNKVSYDAVVFDTYDYMDKVISFSLSDCFIAAFKIYNERYVDERAEQIIELFRYGTNNSKHILLMRYGFPPEMVGDLSEHVASIDETRIVFKKSIHSASSVLREFVEWYLPQSQP